jgi:hypothetical protein
LWREDVEAGAAVSIGWTGHDWVPVPHAQERVPIGDADEPAGLNVRDDEVGRDWIVPVVDVSGRVCWQPPRFTTYTEALAAILDFPIRPAEATDEQEDDDADGSRQPNSGAEHEKDEKTYALHAGAELVERVAALQLTLPPTMIDDWLDHLDRMFRGAFPETLIKTWREYRIDVFSHLSAQELRPPKLTERQRARYLEVLDRCARTWSLR